MTVRLTFHGAAGTVTGSCFRLDTAASSVLVDCGLFQGPKTLRELNYGRFPFEPGGVDAVLLTHAHIDHSGLLTNKPRGVPRADDRRVLNGIYWRLRTGSPWADIPERYGPATTCANRFRRWAKIGVWDRIFEAVSRAYDGGLQMVESSSVRVHQHGGNVTKGVRTPRLPPLAGRESHPDPSRRLAAGHARALVARSDPVAGADQIARPSAASSTSFRRPNAQTTSTPQDMMQPDRRLIQNPVLTGLPTDPWPCKRPHAVRGRRTR